MHRVFDGLSRVKEMYGALEQKTVYGYDAQGNLKSATDPLVHAITNDYDALNRLKKVTEPLLAGALAAGEIAYGYDPQDNLASVTDQRGLTTTYGYSGFDELKTLTSPDTGVTAYTYDPAGNVKTMVDSRGQSATYGYDALNRLKTLLYSDESLAFTYDDITIAPNSKGRLSKVTDGSGSTTYGYDSHGRVTSKVQVAGAVSRQVAYSYNAAGQLATVTTPSNQAIVYGYTNNQIVSVKVNGINVLTGAKYFPFGEVQKWTWGNGQAYERVYDLDGRIQSVTLGGQIRTYGFDDASRIKALTDKQGATTIATATIGYDNLDRLTSALNAASGGYNQTFVYDLIGNRSSQTIGSVTTALTYATTSNRLTKIGTTDIGYDSAGNTVNDGALTYNYSGRNRLVEVKQGASSVATYKHNAFGERVAKTLGGSTTTFIYDEDGHLLGEYGAAGALIQETVWLKDTPIATLRPKAGGGIDIFYVWADHLDTPRVVTTSAAAGTTVWKWESDAFGTTSALESGLAYNLRFPGQYFDAETGTHYNYNRDYDSQNGRYRQSDPIGLLSGPNTYAYVSAQPLYISDPFGLAERRPGWKIPKPQGSCPDCGVGYGKRGTGTGAERDHVGIEWADIRDSANQCSFAPEGWRRKLKRDVFNNKDIVQDRCENCHDKRHKKRPRYGG
jgi:RHS repeat-associated protein